MYHFRGFRITILVTCMGDCVWLWFHLIVCGLIGVISFDNVLLELGWILLSDGGFYESDT